MADFATVSVTTVLRNLSIEAGRFGGSHPRVRLGSHQHQAAFRQPFIVLSLHVRPDRQAMSTHEVSINEQCISLWQEQLEDLLQEELERYIRFLRARERPSDEFDHGLPLHPARVCVVLPSDDNFETLLFVAFPTERQIKAESGAELTKKRKRKRRPGKSAPRPVAEAYGCDEYDFDLYEDLEGDADDYSLESGSVGAMDDEPSRAASLSANADASQPSAFDISALELELNALAEQEDEDQPIIERERAGLEFFLSCVDTGLGFVAMSRQIACQVTLCRRGRNPGGVALPCTGARELKSPEMLIVKRQHT